MEILIFISLLNLGFFGGFLHCSGMCGPFVLMQIGNRLGKIDINQTNSWQRLTGLALLPYHFGRITTYCFIAIFSYFLAGNLKNISAFKDLAGVFLLLAAALIFHSSIAKIRLPFKVNLFTISTAFLRCFFKKLTPKKAKNGSKNLLNKLFTNPKGLSGYFLGILLGFIPCGLTYGAISAALSLPNAFQAFLAMAVFGFATFPGLFAAGCGGFWFFNRAKDKFKIFSKVILMINILTLSIMGLGLIFNKI
jgi:uncharacterized protein